MEIFAIIGMCLVHGSTICQIIKFWQSKKVDGVSIHFWYMIWFGLWSYEIYMFHIGDKILICANTIGITLSSIAICMFWYYRRYGNES